MKLQQKPHGINIGMNYQVFDQRTGKIYQEGSVPKSKLEAMIEITNTKTKQKIVLPMRSFVNVFINKLHGILTGDGGSDTYKSTVSFGASLSASVVEVAGVLIGEGTANVALSDTSLQTQKTGSMAVYKGTTLIAPTVVTNDFGRVELGFEIRRLFGNSDTLGWDIREIGVTSQRVNASAASNAGLQMLARDNIDFNFPYDSNILMNYYFRINQASGGNGGVVLNFMKLIYNLMFAGDQNNANSQLVSRTNNALSGISYATNATAAATNPFVIDGDASEEYIGAVIGYHEQTNPDEAADAGDLASTPDISGDETTFTISHTDITVSANTVSSVTNPYTGVSQFTLTRDFTLDADAATSRTFNRIGLLTKGTADGSTLGSDQVFLAINRPAEPITLLQGLSLRTTYYFQISTGQDA